MKFGARIFKTGIAITLALFLGYSIGLPSPVFAGIAAVFAIQPSIYRSYLTVIEQVQANIIGAIFAIVVGMYLGNNPFIVGLTVIIVIALILKLKIEKTISVAIVTVIAIMESPSDQFFQFALLRFSAILLGILSAFVVNLVFLPPKYEKKLYDKIVEETQEIFKWIRMSVRHASEYNTLKDDIDKIKEHIIQIDQLFLLYKEERNYFKRNKFEKSRKLVLYRQMIISTNRALDTLKRLHRHENELHDMPIDFQQLVIKEIEDLIHHHEQILLKFIGKVKPQAPNELQIDFSFDRKKVIDMFLENQAPNNQEKQENWYQIMTLVSSLLEYSEQLEHLNILVDSFQNFHNEIIVEQA
ncbi:FUSC family protein [Ferdinandcohnia quinoae]|uniref:Aromatic acid exporter family protein n=1 Tax=Fredinandcohnia quinoae TaxID=2918902 RepID=A0AAW5E905_9BACI|nr:aromatic acid exporter family protein [Fredinandcohnia sp. SECRCQ15]MCH1627725.1 aromatic acid exporter family protein [Fredinandcohnia sp. SECRCQ15]